jgi:hypothetical protein
MVKQPKIGNGQVYKSKDGKADMTTKQEYEQYEFMEALDYVGFFKYAQQK